MPLRGGGGAVLCCSACFLSAQLDGEYWMLAKGVHNLYITQGRRVDGSRRGALQYNLCLWCVLSVTATRQKGNRTTQVFREVILLISCIL